MKTSTLRLARRLASVVDIREAQQALVEDAYGVGDWAELFYDDMVSLRDLALKRRERTRRVGGGGKVDTRPRGNRLVSLRAPHGPDHPIAATVDVGDLAVCLMLLPGLVEVGARNLSSVLGSVQPILAVSGRVAGFERHLAGLMKTMFHSSKRKLIVQSVTASDELTHTRSARSDEVVMLHIRSSAMHKAKGTAIRICLSKAMRARMPIVMTREDANFTWPPRMVSAADLAIDAAPLDWPMLAELIDAKIGIAAKTVLVAAPSHAINLAKLSLDDLALAIRPGRKLETILGTLADLAATPPEPSSEDDEDGAATSWTSKSSKRNRNGTSGTGSVRIDPQPLLREVESVSTMADGTSCGRAPSSSGDPVAPAASGVAVDAEDETTTSSTAGDAAVSEAGKDDAIRAAQNEADHSEAQSIETPLTAMPGTDNRQTSKLASGLQGARPAPRRARIAPVVSVETLAGYGKARDWALDLKADLVAWQAGPVPWSDLSSKLLLSGPPGTGKTTFARALGNTLQLPVFATSVATWLEASHLGDVLRRMRDCFEEAGRAKPCILFIDEIDGIGRRQDQNREYADYWNSVVNKMLELMDGAIRSEGIIVVGATNRPDDIEPALRRSGRLETHIVLPKPDMKALQSILAFHLGDDLVDIVASAPERQEMTCAKEIVAACAEAEKLDHAVKASAGSSFSQSASHIGETIVEAGPSELGSALKDEKADAAKDAVRSSTSTTTAVQETSRKRRRSARTKAAKVTDVGQAAVVASFGLRPADMPDPETDAERTHRTLRLLARAASSLTGADVERIVREERQRCRRAHTVMEFDPLRTALREGRTDLPADLRRQIAVHEAGHALALRALALGTQGEMTIDAADGGVTRSEMDARTIQSEDRLMDLIAMKLAGRAAEIACGLAPFAGSGLGDGTDLQAATALALELECRAGFAADAPLLHVEPGNGNALHLARPDAYRKANVRLERAHAMAQQIIERHRDAHGALVDALIVNGSLDGNEVDAILEPRMTRAE